MEERSEEKKLTREQREEIAKYVSVPAHRRSGYKIELSKKYGVSLVEINKVKPYPEDGRCSCGNPVPRLRTGCSQSCIFKASVREEENGCWTWLGTLDTNYSKPFFVCTKVREGDKSLHMYAARYAYNTWVHETDNWITNTCGNPLCVNPAHMTEMIREKQTGRPPSSSRLSSEDVLRIRDSELSNVELSEEFGVSQTTIRKIRVGAVRMDVGGRILLPGSIPRRLRKLGKDTILGILEELSQGVTGRELAEKYGVNESAISRISRGKYRFRETENTCLNCGIKIRSGKYCSLECNIAHKLIKTDSGCWQMPGDKIQVSHKDRSVNVRTFLSKANTRGSRCGNPCCVNPEHAVIISSAVDRKKLKKMEGLETKAPVMEPEERSGTEDKFALPERFLD